MGMRIRRHVDNGIEAALKVSGGIRMLLVLVEYIQVYTVGREIRVLYEYEYIPVRVLYVLVPYLYTGIMYVPVLY